MDTQETQNKKGFPGIGWLSSRLSRKLIVIVVALALLDWCVISLHFVDALQAIYTAADPAVASWYAALSMLLFNLLVLAVAAILFFLLVIAPIVRLRKTIQQYSASGQAPERTVRSDEIGRLQNAFVELTETIERKEQAERRLIASISHDIKTPLTSVLGYSERLRSNNLSPERKEQYLDLIHEKALHLKAMVDEFDDYLDMGLRDTAPMSLMDAGELCRRLQREYSNELEDAGVSFRVECLAPEAQLICSWEHMRRLFGNLISNSINHAQAPHLALELQCRKEDDRLLLSFRDNGVGVPPELLDQIFEPLYTSDRGRKVSGLGLAICGSIVKAHGGVIHAQNAPTGGLLIEMTFPWVEL